MTCKGLNTDFTVIIPTDQTENSDLIQAQVTYQSTLQAAWTASGRFFEGMMNGDAGAFKKMRPACSGGPLGSISDGKSKLLKSKPKLNPFDVALE